MKTEDYKRAVRAMGELTPNDRAALTIMLKENGTLFVSTCGEPEWLGVLLDKFAAYCEATAEQMEGGRK